MDRLLWKPNGCNWLITWCECWLEMERWKIPKWVDNHLTMSLVLISVSAKQKPKRSFLCKLIFAQSLSTFISFSAPHKLQSQIRFADEGRFLPPLHFVISFFFFLFTSFLDFLIGIFLKHLRWTADLTFDICHQSIKWNIHFADW